MPSDTKRVPARVRLARITDASLLPAIERSAGEAFRREPGLEWIADGDDIPAALHRRRIAAGIAAVPGDIPVGFLSAGVSGHGCIFGNWQSVLVYRSRGLVVRFCWLEYILRGNAPWMGSH